MLIMECNVISYRLITGSIVITNMFILQVSLLKCAEHSRFSQRNYNLIEIIECMQMFAFYHTCAKFLSSLKFVGTVFGVNSR